MKENFFPECLSKDYANALRRIRETIALKSTLVTKPKDNFVSESIEMKRVSKNERWVLFTFHSQWIVDSEHENMKWSICLLQYFH